MKSESKNHKRSLKIHSNYSKEELINRLKEYNHRYEYVRVSNHVDYDICLELTWQQHSKPFVEYYFLANYEKGMIVGEIVDRNKSGVKSKVKKPNLFEMLQIIGFILLGLIFIYGIPFAIVYAISGKLFLSLGIATIPLTFIIVMILKESDHISVHSKNIYQLFSEL